VDAVDAEQRADCGRQRWHQQMEREIGGAANENHCQAGTNQRDESATFGKGSETKRHVPKLRRFVP
jgi:hypothetical protein